MDRAGRPKIVARQLSVGVAALLVFLGCSSASPEPGKLGAALSDYANPQSDVQFVLRAIEGETANCMIRLGFEEWVETSRPASDLIAGISVALDGLPGIVVVDERSRKYVGQAAQDEDENTRQRGAASKSKEDTKLGEGDTLGHESEVATVDALLGLPGSDSVFFSIPGAGEIEQDLGGCLGVGYSSILKVDEIPKFLAGEFLLLNLPGQIQWKALNRTGGMTEWSNCMARTSLSVETPFDARAQQETAPEGKVAAQDYACRNETDLESAYAIAVETELAGSPVAMMEVLDEFGQIASAVRARLTP